MGPPLKTGTVTHCHRGEEHTKGTQNLDKEKQWYVRSWKAFWKATGTQGRWAEERSQVNPEAEKEADKSHIPPEYLGSETNH